MLEVLSLVWLLTAKADPIDDVVYARSDMVANNARLSIGCSQGTYGQIGFNIVLPKSALAYGDTRVTIRFDDDPPKDYLFIGHGESVAPVRPQMVDELIERLGRTSSVLFRVRAASNKTVDIPVQEFSGRDTISKVKEICASAALKNE